MRFKVDVDLWIKFVLYLSSFSIFIVIPFVPTSEKIIVLLIGLFVSVLIIPILWTGYYELREDHLYIRIWFLFKRIKYKNIKSIEEAKGLQNNFALARERVRIREFNKSKLNYTDISPVDRDRFIFELNTLVKKAQFKAFEE